MQRFQVFCRSRELPAAHAEKTYDVNAGSFHTAALRGIKLFRAEPRVNRRHLTCIELRVTKLGPAAGPHEMLLPLGDAESAPLESR